MLRLAGFAGRTGGRSGHNAGSAVEHLGAGEVVIGRRVDAQLDVTAGTVVSGHVEPVVGALGGVEGNPAGVDPRGDVVIGTDGGRSVVEEGAVVAAVHAEDRVEAA